MSTNRHTASPLPRWIRWAAISTTLIVLWWLSTTSSDQPVKVVKTSALRVQVVIADPRETHRILAPLPAPPTASDVLMPLAAAPASAAGPYSATTATLSNETALSPVFRIATKQRVAFLTIDDGMTRSPLFLSHLLAAHVPVTIFPTAQAATAEPGFFTPMLAAGASLGNHTVTHTALSTLSANGQAHEICAAASAERQILGVAPVMFRPPYGDVGQGTGAAAASCGMGYELLWDAVVNDGVVTNYTGKVTASHPLVPGDIILMHFRPTFLADFDAALAAAKRSNLQIAAITSYLPPTRSSAAAQASQDAALRYFPAVAALLPTGSHRGTAAIVPLSATAAPWRPGRATGH